MWIASRFTFSMRKIGMENWKHWKQVGKLETSRALLHGNKIFLIKCSACLMN